MLHERSIDPIDTSRLLGREPVELDQGALVGISGKRVLVTGGAGSIGSELCRQLLSLGAARLCILDINENDSYTLLCELEREHPGASVGLTIASVRDRRRIAEIFSRERPQLVLHVAAHKHVPLMEADPGEAIKNNIFGTKNVADCADEFGVERFVLISSDKAVNPTNAMGATKRVCEWIIEAASTRSRTRFSAVRFGNVVDSSGSVIPTFRRLLERRLPLTVTSREITRYFMTIPEAAQLVLQAMTLAESGEIFVLDMGEPVRIYDLAERMIRLCGFEPNVDIPIEITGLRPGEKLYEEPLLAEEGLTGTVNRKIFVSRVSRITPDELDAKLARLAEVVDSDSETVKRALSSVVQSYTPEL